MRGPRSSSYGRAASGSSGGGGAPGTASQQQAGAGQIAGVDGGYIAHMHAVPSVPAPGKPSMPVCKWASRPHLQRADGPLLPAQRQPRGTARCRAIPGCRGDPHSWVEPGKVRSRCCGRLGSRPAPKSASRAARCPGRCRRCCQKVTYMQAQGAPGAPARPASRLPHRPASRRTHRRSSAAGAA